MGIYLVEPQYFDDAKKKATGLGKRKCKGRRSQDAQKIRRNGMRDTGTSNNGGNMESKGESDTDEDEDDHVVDRDLVGIGGTGSVNNPSTIETTDRPGIVVGTQDCNLRQLLPTTAGLSEVEYESIAMDAFINARMRGHCRRWVTDQYFGNKGDQTYFELAQKLTIHLTDLEADGFCCNRCV
jgi:hypothetical protein